VSDRPTLATQLTEQWQFRKRGEGMTRLETFCDAAFAFALTMLVISIESIPGNYPELVAALKGAPAFAASFAQIMIFWAGHRAWSEHYGLDRGWAVVLSCVLIFFVLVYVYPLKIIFGAFFAWATGGWLPSGFEISNFAELNRLFTIYGVGFTAMSLSLVLLYLYAWRQRDVLHLNTLERHATSWAILSWSIVMATGIGATLLALFLPGDLAGYSGFFYSTLGVSMPLVARAGRQRQRRLAPSGR
jgi:uncharacterized membrane protein